ncbi:MAG: hypothetical protein HQ515_18995, partial [Phycisphaeraceae bacterium]|nr:hypothetical protein [Phycisphaeraceae bacterium]
AARILTPQERIEQLTEISKNYGYASSVGTKEDRIQVSGIIRTWDGLPLPGRIDATLDLESRHGSFIRSIGASKLDTQPDMAEFHTAVTRGEFWMKVFAEGYAPAAAGPFDAKPGQDITDIELTLEQGFVGKIQVVNEAQKPIENATLTGGYTFGQSLSYQHTIALKTDAQGMCQLDHASGQAMSLRIAASGYEPTPFKSIILAPKKTTQLVLPKAQPITGTVISRETDFPIPNAEIRVLLMRRASHSSHLKQVESDPDTLTDDRGLFALDQVRHGWEHVIHVTAEGHGHVYLEHVPAGKQGLRIELTKKKTIRGTVLGDLSQLQTDASGQPAITFQNEYIGYGAHHATAPVTSKGDTGVFEINDVWGQTVTIQAGYKEITVKPDQDSLDNIVIDLRPSVTRDVILQFDIPENMPPIQGHVQIYKTTQRSGSHVKSKTEWVEIADNQASFKSSAPGQFNYSLDVHRNKPVGYWFKNSKRMNVATGNEPLVIHVPVYPAGAIYGKITWQDGAPARRANASLVVVKRPDPSASNLVNILSNKVNLGTFNATPLPLGGTYAIKAHEDYAVAITKPFTLDQATPIVEANLQLPRGVTVTGQLLDPKGKPATNPVSLNISIQRGESNSSFSGPELEPDQNGQFVFENVNPGPGGTCTIRVIGQTGFRPIRQEIKNLSKPVIIRLQKGQRVTGTVIDQATGWPVPGMEVYA